jgi:serine protease Do
MDLISMRGRWKAAPAAIFLVVLAVASMAQAQVQKELRIITPEAAGSYLGIEMEDVTADNVANYKLSGERGVIVRSVEKGSPAEAATLQAKDVILEYAATPVFSSAQFARLVRETPVGRKVDLVISREGKKLNLSAKVGQREGDADRIGRSIRIVPDENEDQGFGFGGPDGRGFRFQIPGGPGNGFAMPRRGFGVSTPGKPRLGIELQPLTAQMAEFLGISGKKGVLVSTVMDNVPAAGKLKAGDVIVRADDRAIENPEDLTQLLANKDSKAKVELKIVRNKQEQTIVVELAQPEGPAKKGRGYRL